MKSIKLIGISLGLLALAACSSDFQDEGLLNTETRGYTGTAPVIDVAITNANGSTSFTTSGYYRYKGSGIKSNGFVYSVYDSMPYIKKSLCFTKLVSAKTDTISYNFTSLLIGKTYFVRAYSVSTSGDTVYSDVVNYVAKPSSPTVETLPIFNRVRVAAIVCGRFTKGGDGLLKYGCCLSRSPLPTVKDGIMVLATDTATDATYHGYFGVFFDNLEPNTMYHVRAFAINSTDTVYGQDRIFKTSLGGDFSWGWNNKSSAESAGAADRITQAVDSAMFYYRNYTNLNKYLYINYSPGTPTADCNINGWMNVGAVERYQWVGTIQHEMCHALGVGTASNWSSFGSPWDKPYAVLTLRVMMHDMTEHITHDGLHFWPGGINQREEVTNGTTNLIGTYTCSNAAMLKANALIINAMRWDGLLSY